MLESLVEAHGLDCNCAPRIATAFGGGIGRWGEVCGAVAGAAMALGTRFGRERADDIETRGALYDRMDAFMSAFEAEFGSVRCIELTGCDMRTPEGLAKSGELDLHGRVCPRFVEFAAREAAGLLDRE